MVDSPAAPAATESAAPAPAAPVVQPVVAAPDPVATPKAEPAPAPSAVHAEPVVAKSAEVIPPEPPPTTLLTEAVKPPEKPVEAKPPEKSPEPTPEPAPITYEAFKLPEGLEANGKEMETYVDVLKEFKAPQELGQKLIDLHVAELQKIVALQQETWQKTLDTWRNDTLADPELGGNRLQTVLTRCQGVLDEFADQDFRQMLAVTGLGNHRSMVRFLDKVAAFVAEPGPRVAQGAKPVPDAKPSRAQRRYGRNGAQPAGSP